MLDPFPPPPPSLADAVSPLAHRLGLLTLPLHVHEVIFSCAFYHFVYAFLSPIISKWLFPSFYTSLSRRRAINWDTKVTSLVQSTVVTSFALFVIWTDEERKQMDWAERIWGYTGAGGAVQGFAAGYFIWDLMISLLHLDVHGVGSLAHAMSALLVTSLGFRPFANYYGLSFILYEISTPFLNIHWFFDKLNMTGSRIQLYNGIILLVSFFCCRVVWGNYQSLRIYSDVWTAFGTSIPDLEHIRNDLAFKHQKHAYGLATEGYMGNMSMPLWLGITYLGGNTVLNFLNVYWFGLMIQALRKRFQEPSSVSEDDKARPRKFAREHLE